MSYYSCLILYPLPLTSYWNLICAVCISFHLPPRLLYWFICHGCTTIHLVEFLFSPSKIKNQTNPYVTPPIVTFLHPIFELILFHFVFSFILVPPSLVLDEKKIQQGDQDEKLHTTTKNKHMHMPTGRIIKHQQTQRCDRKTQMRWQRRDVAIAIQCADAPFSLTGEDNVE